MIRIYFPMQKVPKWILRGSPKYGARHVYKAPKIVFGSFIVVYKMKGSTFLINIWPYARFIRVTNGENFNLNFTPVYFKCVIGAIKDAFKWKN